MLQTPPVLSSGPSPAAAAVADPPQAPSALTPPTPVPAAAASVDAPAKAQELPGIEEIVTRPEPGLRRGKYEARPWAFGLLLAVAVIFVLGYLARRFRWLTRKKS